MLLKGLVAAAAAFALSLPVALAAAPVRIAPGQRVDLRVLLISADGKEPGYGAWQAALDREGVPYDTVIATQAPPLSDAQLADYAGAHARYQAVILAGGDLGTEVRNAGGTASYLSAFSDGEWATLAKFERTFGIRQLSDYTAPSPAHGLTPVAGETKDGQVGLLTPAGRAAFPYLKGPVAVADDDAASAETFGYAAKPVDPSAWQTLLAGPLDTAFLGIYTHPDDGREELVMTVASNQFQNHNQLLRHGMLNWVTRGVYLGYARNYLELQVDDLFLGDDAWDETANATSYDAERASRMTPGDVDRAIAWSRARGLRLDMAYNGGGSALEGPGDPLAAKFADPAVRDAFGYVNHTYEHPNLDCSSAPFIRNQINQNVAWGRARGFAVDASEVVTGEHSGLANSRPGNPGTIDPPSIDDVEPVAGGTVPVGTYDYALTAHSATGETIPSIVPNVAVAAIGSMQVSFNAVCHAVAFDLYRRAATTGAWARVGSLARAADAPTDQAGQPITLSITDTGATSVAADPPAANGATLAAYGQNPNLSAGLAAAGITTVASDASKGYPSTPTVITGPLYPPGASWTQGSVRAVPRYPSNVYYNVSRQGQQLDEYNWIYVAPANGGGCVAIPNVTTCRTTPATWGEYVTSETRVMFRHLADNDPRPHFFHQSNLADYNPDLPETDLAQGGILYPVIGALVDRYEAAFDRGNSRLVQLTQTQIAEALARADAWTAAKASVGAWVQDGRVYVRNAGASAVTAPLTGTTVGDDYAGQRSGWVAVGAGATAEYAPVNPANTAAPGVAGTPRVGDQLTASPGTWSGSPAFAYQWQRCAPACANIAGATGSEYELTDADKGAKVRVAVLAGNWVSSVSQAFSLPTAEVAARPVKPRDETRKDDDPPPRGGGSQPGARGVALKLTKLKMSPRRFAVSHKRLPKGTKIDGARISWTLSRAATVKLTFQRHTRKGWTRVGVISRASKAGAGEVRFRGRFGRKLLKPQRYRLVVAASGGGDRTPARRLAFRVLKG